MRLGRVLVVVAIAALGLVFALPAAAPAAKKKPKTPKVTLVGFAVVPVSIDNLTAIPAIPAALTKSGGTITDCGGAIPAKVPRGTGFAGLMIVTKLAGKANFINGALSRPDGSGAALTFGKSSKPSTAVISDSGGLQIIDTNGAYKVTATVLVKTAPRKFKKVQTLKGSVTVSCPGA